MVMRTSLTLQGRNSLKAFDKAGIPVDAAFWSLDDDDDQWRFYLHTLLYNLPRQQVYGRIRDALSSKPETVELQAVSLLPEKSDLLRMMRSTYSSGLTPDFEYEITNVAIGGHFFRHLLIYRL
jgi:hypothetical protein